MIQLRATYDNQVYDLDLYEESPIKLNLSVEDITNADATSTYSRTFRVPATRNNNKFFKNAFLINGIDYDVTIKKPAVILVNGSEFRQGHIRLQKIYTNGAINHTDYEILFLGETRDFASILGDAAMCDLNIPSLDDASVTYGDIVNSWNAYPQTDDIGAYKGGDVIFPLIDHGNTYDTGNISDSQINIDPSGPTFVNNGYPISYDRLKPMIRLRLLFQKIFESAGFTINFPLLETDRFRHIYVSAFGNDATPYVTFNDTYTLGFNVEDAMWFNPSGPVPTNVQKIDWQVEQLDPGNNFDLTNDWYVVPQAASGATITFQSRISWEEISGIGSGSYALQLYKVGQTPPVAQSIFGVSAFGSGTVTMTQSVAVAAGEKYYMAIAYLSGNAKIAPGYSTLIDYFKTGTITSGPYNPVKDLDCDYKQIDFVKDVLTTFRLVMEPDNKMPRQFNIKPFDQYIATGDTYNWSDKLDRAKDLTIEPLFNTQSDQITFSFTPEGDWVNDYHQKAYKYTYGRLLFDSGNDLLVGKREIKTNFGSTEVTQIEGTGTTPSSPKTWVIPQVHTHTGSDQQHQPIKAKTRLLFYNGLYDNNTDYGHWHMSPQLSTEPRTSATHLTQNNWPLVTQYEHFTPQTNSLILNFNRDIAYWYDNTPGGYNSGENLNGVSLYSAYWNNYILSLYNKFSRRVTGTFVLTYDDLKDFSFDDIVFLDNTYYRVEKITDATLMGTAPTRVDLIKLNDYNPNSLPAGVINVTLTPTDTTCYGDSDGQLEVVYTGGVGPYTYSVNGGPQITAPASPFTLTGLSASNYTVTITDANSAIGTDTEVIADGNPQLFLNISYRPVTSCGGSDGSATYTVSGGTAPYYITGVFGSYAGVTSKTEVGISAGQYTISVVDAVGCSTYATLNMTEPANCIDESLITDIRQQDYTVNCFEQGVGWTPESGSTVIVTVGSGTHIGKYAWLGNTWSDFTSTYPIGSVVDIQNLIYPSIQCGEWVKYDISTPYFSIGEDGLCVQCSQPQGPSDSFTNYTSLKGNWNWSV